MRGLAGLLLLVFAAAFSGFSGHGGAAGLMADCPALTAGAVTDSAAAVTRAPGDPSSCPGGPGSRPGSASCADCMIGSGSLATLPEPVRTAPLAAPRVWHRNPGNRTTKPNAFARSPVRLSR